jgi:hypothetical protein
MFRNFSAAEVPDDLKLVDELTPNFAGIIDRHTWAGRGGAWINDPANLDCFWHTGYFPATVQLQVGVHPGKDPAASTILRLSNQEQPKQGYVLQAERTWTANTVSLTLTRQGQPAAQGQAKVQVGKAYALGLYRYGPQLLVEVDGAPVLMFNDKQPLAGLDRLGLEQRGSLIYADDIAVTTPQVHDYTFETAPIDWTVKAGTWEITSRWSCTPGWAWFTGYNADGYATIATKQTYEGDQDVTFYVGAKMMPAANNQHTEKLTDVLAGFLEGDTGTDPGYRFVIGGSNNTVTTLSRNGVQVATSDYRLPSEGIHNDWLRITMRKRGNKISAWAWDSKILEYDDPQPLTAGRVSVGTYQNGLLVPRLTIFGKQAS